MSPIQTVLELLLSIRKSGKGWSAQCPAHDDRSPSLSISEGADGRVLLFCHAGCTTESVVAALGLKMSDLMSNNSNYTPTIKELPVRYDTFELAFASLEKAYGPATNFWKYFDKTGDLVEVVVRWNQKDGGKTFRPISRIGDKWQIAAMPSQRPLYHLPKLADQTLVFVVEGEKAADAICSIGLSGTTSAGGSNAAQKTDWTPLAGKKVIILPDNDEPGQKYAKWVEDHLKQLSPPAIVCVVQLPGLPEKGDIVEWIEQTKALNPQADLKRELAELIQNIANNTTESDAESPEPIEDDAGDYRPFPVDALPEPMRSFVAEGAKAIGCDESYLALPLLSALGTCIGNTRRLQVKPGWMVPPILWTCIVGESGTSKTPAFRAVMKPLRKIELKIAEEYAKIEAEICIKMQIYEKEMSFWKRKKDNSDPPEKPEIPGRVRYTIQDTTLEALTQVLAANPRGILVARDELAGWLKSFDKYSPKGNSGSDASSWLSMYNAETIQVDRKTGFPKTIYIPNAAVGVTGGIQPGILKKTICGDHRESGLAARLLLASPPRLPKSWREDSISQDLEDKVTIVFERLIELMPHVDDDGISKPQITMLHPSAKERWIHFYENHAKEQVQLEGDLAAAWSKLEETAARIALIIHWVKKVADRDSAPWANTTLQLETMEQAILLTEWFKREAKRVYGILDESDDEKNRRRLLDWIDRQTELVTARRVQQYCKWLSKSGAAEAALVSLEKDGVGYWVSSEPGTRGTKTRYFHLRKPSTVYAKDNKPADTVETVDVDNEEKAKEIVPDGQLFPSEQRLPD